MHLDAEQIQRLLDHELAALEEAAAREHVAHCAACRRRVAEAEQADAELDALLRQLDHEPPHVSAADIAPLARARAPRFRWAAGILLALGLAGAAYAAPGSPLREWVRAIVGRARGGVKQSPELRAGIAVTPGRALVISFTAVQQGGQVQISFTDGAEVVVRAPIGAATFTSDVERLVIHNAGEGSPATFAIEIPRSAPLVEVQVRGVRRFLKEGPGVTGSLTFPLAP